MSSIFHHQKILRQLVLRDYATALSLRHEGWSSVDIVQYPLKWFNYEKYTHMFTKMYDGAMQQFLKYYAKLNNEPHNPRYQAYTVHFACDVLDPCHQVDWKADSFMKSLQQMMTHMKIEHQVANMEWVHPIHVDRISDPRTYLRDMAKKTHKNVFEVPRFELMDHYDKVVIPAQLQAAASILQAVI